MQPGLTLRLLLSRQPMGTPAEEAAVEELDDLIGQEVMGIGEAVGYDIGDGEAVMYVGGHDIARLVEVVLPLARTFPWGPGSHVIVGDGNDERRIEL
jgi:hypothetical protein